MINKISISIILKNCLLAVSLVTLGCSLLRENYQRLPAETMDIPLENYVLKKAENNVVRNETAGWIIWVDGWKVFVRLNDGIKIKEGAYLHVYSNSPEADGKGIYKGMLRVKRILREGVIETEVVRGINITNLFTPLVLPGDVVFDKKK